MTFDESVALLRQELAERAGPRPPQAELSKRLCDVTRAAWLALPSEAYDELVLHAGPLAVSLTGAIRRRDGRQGVQQAASAPSSFHAASARRP